MCSLLRQRCACVKLKRSRPNNYGVYFTENQSRATHFLTTDRWQLCRAGFINLLTMADTYEISRAVIVVQSFNCKTTDHSADRSLAFVANSESPLVCDSTQLTAFFPNTAPPTSSSPPAACRSWCRGAARSRRRRSPPHTPRPPPCSPAQTRCW